MANGYRKFHRYLVLIFMLLLPGGIALAQTTQQFTGHVTDTSGALIAHAKVVVHNQESGVDTPTETTSQGVYTVPYLKPGTYTITAEKQGFKTEQKTDILLNVDQTSTIDFHLPIGAANETVTVDASGDQLEFTKADRGELIESERVTEMPLDGRNPFLLTSLSPGVHDFTNPQWPRPFDDITDNQYANGSPQQPALSIDGITNSMGKDNRAGFGTNSGIVPSADAVQEFKVVLSQLDASYGRGGGSTVDVAMKSGTNQFHGTLDYFKRASWLDAYSWASKYNTTTPVKAPHNRNQWSVEFDGPVKIPYLFNGKDRLFFTVSYEEMRDLLPENDTYTFSLPNPAWATGDFSSMQYWNQATNSAMQLKIYDPLSPLHTYVDPVDGVTKQAHDQFPGNIVPQNRIDPIGQTLLKMLSQVKPNFDPGPGYAPYTNNWRVQPFENDLWRNGLVKVDYALSNADRLSFRWSGQGRWQSSCTHTCYPNSVPFNMNEAGSFQPKSQSGAVEWTHTFSPKLLFDLHSTLMSQANRTSLGPQGGNWLQQLGFNQAFYSQVQNLNQFPLMYFDGVLNGADGEMGSDYGTGGGFYLHTLGLLPTITWIRGQHTVRAGMDIQFQQEANPTGGAPYPHYFEFGSQFTNQFFNFSDAPNYSSGASWASALLGYPYSGAVYDVVHDFESNHYFAPWVQDDWKVTKKLTLNLGFRWDFQTPKVERWNKVDGAFNTSVVNPASSQLPFQVKGGMTFAGVNGAPRAAYAMNWDDWQPRVGFAYAMAPNMSLRAGVGKNMLVDSTMNGTLGYSASTGYVASLDGGLTPYTATTGQGLSNPFQTINQPTGASLGYLTNMGNSYSFVNPNYKIPSFWNYSATLQVGLTKRDVFSLGYVGNITPDYPVTDNINHEDASFLRQCDGEEVGWVDPAVTWTTSKAPHHVCDDNVAANTIGYEANPFKGVSAFAGSSYYGATRITRADTTRPYFGWKDLTETGANNNEKLWYNSLQVTAEHQVSHSLSLHFNYTHATAMTAGNFLDTNYRILARQVSTTNQVKHAINFSGIAYLPFGRGRAFLSGANRWVDEVVNGWEFSPLVSYYSGFPWRPGGTWEWNTDLPMGVDHTTISSGTRSFKRIRGVTPCVGYRNSETGAVVPSPAATAAGCTNILYVQAGSYATPRNVVDFGVTQPGAIKFDASIAKSFGVPGVGKVLSENTKLQLRLDVLNVLNHPNWDMGYNGSPSSQDWGTISKGPSSPSNNQRFLQLSGKFSW